MTRNQVLPFAVAVLLLFGFALGPGEAELEAGGAGPVLGHGPVRDDPRRATDFGLERADNALRPRCGSRGSIRWCLPRQVRRPLRSSSPCSSACWHWSPACCSGSRWRAARSSPSPRWSATAGLVAVGTIYGILSANSNVHETLLPLLFLPVAAPVLLGAVKSLAARDRGTRRARRSDGSASSCIRGDLRGDRDRGVRHALGGRVDGV